jgi:hypothetical protein
MLILPGDPEFNLTLATPPPNWRQVAERLSGEYAFVARAGSGMLEPVSFGELDEYLDGGEYDERMSEIEAEEEWDELVTFS